MKSSQVIAVDVDELDIANLIEVRKYLIEIHTDVIINCAGYTNVDACVSNEDLAYKVNSIGVRNSCGTNRS